MCLEVVLSLQMELFGQEEILQLFVLLLEVFVEIGHLLLFCKLEPTHLGGEGLTGVFLGAQLALQALDDHLGLTHPVLFLLPQ